MRIENMRRRRRTLIDPHKRDKRYVHRNQKGQFKGGVSRGRSLAIDRPQKAKNEASATVAIATGKQLLFDSDGCFVP